MPRWATDACIAGPSLPWPCFMAQSRSQSDADGRAHHRIAVAGAASDLMVYNLSYRPGTPTAVPTLRLSGYSNSKSQLDHTPEVGRSPCWLEFNCTLGVRSDLINHGLLMEAMHLLQQAFMSSSQFYHRELFQLIVADISWASA